jgi:hypothetical protein
MKAKPKWLVRLTRWEDSSPLKPRMTSKNTCWT